MKQTIDDNGYTRDERGRLLHRSICRQKNGKFPIHWHVHHIDGDKKNNKAENLIALDPMVHWIIHTAFEQDELPDRERCKRINDKFRFKMHKFFYEQLPAKNKKEKPKRTKVNKRKKSYQKMVSKNYAGPVYRYDPKTGEKSPIYVRKKRQKIAYKIAQEIKRLDENCQIKTASNEQVMIIRKCQQKESVDKQT